jgi:hypothetical protein
MAQSIVIEVYTAKQLKDSPTTLDEAVKVINLAFRKMWDQGFEHPRFNNTNQLLEALGPEGMCAVARQNDQIIASASIVPWQPDAAGVVYQALQQDRPDDFALMTQGMSYELKAASTLNTPASRGKGLVGMCTTELVSRLHDRHSDVSRALLWVQIADDQNGAYWRRRGYEQVGPVEIKPKGLWASVRDFNFVTLVKHINMLI